MKKLKVLMTTAAVAVALMAPSFAEAKKVKRASHKTHVSRSKSAKHGLKKKKNHSSVSRKKTRGYASASDYLKKGKKAKKMKKSQRRY